MAETAVSPNNAAIKYRGKAERKMPSVSQAQNRFMHAVAEGKVKGVAKSVGKDFVRADEGRKIKKLPKRVRRMQRSGRISAKAAQKHFGA